MKRTRIIIVDDEPGARERLVELVGQDPTLEVVTECRNGADAVLAIAKHKPDLVLLDVQMPLMDGFEVVRRIGASRMPITIFVTAYDQYALKAFDVNAVDYLLKPYDDMRLHAAIAKAKKLKAKAKAKTAKRGGAKKAVGKNARKPAAKKTLREPSRRAAYARSPR